MTAKATWNTGSDEPRISCGSLSGVLRGDHLTDLAWDGAEIPGTLLRVTTPGGELPPAAETYVRGSDFVSTHEATDTFPFRTQLLWSAESLADGAVQVALTVSLQTDLLDSDPELTFTSELPHADRAEPWQDEAVVFAGGDGPSLLVTPHPSDAVECSPSVNGTSGAVRLSPAFLEKGVIRRCRVAAVWMPGSTDDTTVASAIERFADAPLPLTT